MDVGDIDGFLDDGHLNGHQLERVIAALCELEGRNGLQTSEVLLLGYTGEIPEDDDSDLWHWFCLARCWVEYAPEVARA